jgi:dTMP kinase
MIIAIEGIDGSGKTTQAFLAAKDFRAIQLKFPDYRTMPQIREFLEGRIHLHPKSLFLMYLADICQGISKIDNEHNLIILDRYIYSTVAYARSMDRDVAMDIIEKIALPVPDAVFWIDVGIDNAMTRKANHKEPDRNEKDVELLREVRSVYEIMFNKNFYAKQWFRIDGNRNIQQVYNEMKPMLENMIKGTQ